MTRKAAVHRKRGWMLLVVLLTAIFVGLFGNAEAQDNYERYNPRNPYVYYSTQNPMNDYHHRTTTNPTMVLQADDNFGLERARTQPEERSSQAAAYGGPFSQAPVIPGNVSQSVVVDAELALTGEGSVAFVASAMALFLTGGFATIATRERQV